MMTLVDWMISILHKPRSTGTEGAKADTEGVTLEVLVESRGYTVNPTKDMACRLKRRTISTRRLQPTREPLVLSYQRLVGTALPPEVLLEVTGVPDPHSLRTTLNNTRHLAPAATETCPMYLDDHSQATRGRIRVLVQTWGNKLAMMILYAATVIPRQLVDRALPSDSPVAVLDRLPTPRAKVEQAKAMVREDTVDIRVT